MVPRPVLSSWDPALSLPARLWLWISLRVVVLLGLRQNALLQHITATASPKCPNLWDFNSVGGARRAGDKRRGFFCRCGGCSQPQRLRLPQHSFFLRKPE